MINQRSSVIKKRIYILLAIAVTHLLTLGIYPLMDNTEARYAEIAREMVTTNNWITLQLEPGEPFWAKPPLSTWLTAMSFKVFGINEFAARLPSALLAFLTCFLVFLLGRRLAGLTIGLNAVLILSTIGFFNVLAAAVMTDPALNTAITLSLVSFVFALESREKWKQRLWGYLFFSGLGFGLLAKGPICCVLTFMPIIIWTIWHKQWKNVLASFPWMTGSILALGIAAPWHILAEQKTPGFLKYYLVGEHFQRFIVSDWKGDLYGSAHVEPKGMIWAFMIPATMPWTVVAVFLMVWFKKQGEKVRHIMNDRWVSFLVLWFLSPFLFFTLASNITIYYCLPSLSAFALLMAVGLDRAKRINRNEEIPWFISERKLIYVAAFSPVFIFVTSFALMPWIGRNKSQLNVVEMFKQSADDNGSKILYVQGMPQSADFYSQGRALDISKEDFTRTKGRFSDAHKDFFAIKIDHLKNTHGFIRDNTVEIGRFAEYTLRKEL